MSGYRQGPVAYFRYIDQWRSSGDYAGLEFGSPRPEPPIQPVATRG